ncbi:hypothetical protein LSH36_37g00025 [Paralvinella palmiformis]|uniref:EGF-like domain-containing protein n=1 Tax=Paralvinella palmiformis TaxID=53620 RepID=A0AAD9K847_9ANNE|nr:hypothetical protein LSH36_37g00025 [Paralvinella palmiformis]
MSYGIVINKPKGECAYCEDLPIDHQYDILQPYLYHHGPEHDHRVIRESQPETYGNNTYEEVPPHRSSPLSLDTPMVQCREFVKKALYSYWEESYVSGHHIVISDPDRTVSVLEPLKVGGCSDRLIATVAETAKQSNCLVAINAGFYNTTSQACYGNVISDARMAHNSGGIQNVHFGIETDGSLIFGYLPPDVMLESSFKQLVGGVIWLVRDGINYVDVSKNVEWSASQENGNLQTFIDIKSARVAVGHDKHGKLVIVVVDGHSWESGLNLHQFADLLIELGVINAINLDGGGSATVLINGTLVNYPGDRCCEREVSTILCVHDIPCQPGNCNDHGNCQHGKCECNDFWSGSSCDVLSCGETNCSGNGECTESGCLCSPGYQGDDCSNDCPLGYYGEQCRFMCNCSHGELCDPITGRCLCNAGYMGFQCETTCPYGYYGHDCKGLCDCSDGCSCHPVTGHCHVPPSLPTVWQFGHCVSDKVIISRDKIPIDPDQYYLLLSCLTVVAIIAVGSIILNVILLSYKISRSTESLLRETKSTPLPCLRSPTLVDSSSHESLSDNSPHDADVDSSSDVQSRSFLSRIGLKREKRRDQRGLWRTWRKVSRKRTKHGESLTSDCEKEEGGVPNNAAQFIEQPLGPVFSDEMNGKMQGSLPSTGQQRKTSERTDELLEEISLELSSSEHRSLNYQSRDTSMHLRQSSLQSINVLQEESIL